MMEYKTAKAQIETAIELLRHARNNITRETYERIVDELCADGNFRSPLLEACNIAMGRHQEAMSRARGLD